MPICLRLLVHCARRADSRAACTAGKSSATRTPMMAITTSSSTGVNPRFGRELQSQQEQHMTPPGSSAQLTSTPSIQHFGKDTTGLGPRALHSMNLQEQIDLLTIFY